MYMTFKKLFWQYFTTTDENQFARQQKAIFYDKVCSMNDDKHCNVESIYFYLLYIT